jgi:hypothetical protein
VRGGSWTGIGLAVLLVGALTAAACSGDAAPDAGEDGPHYVVLDGAGWELREAVRSRSGPGPLARAEPSLDWWAEYERLVPRGAGVTEGQSVRVSGHLVGLDEHLGELKGFNGSEGEVGGRPGRVARGPDGPAVVTMAITPTYTVMALSYELSVDDLRAFAADLEDATEAEWRAHGGQVVDCLPVDPSCRGG